MIKKSIIRITPKQALNYKLVVLVLLKKFKRVDPNPYVINLPSHFGYHLNFNVEDLVAYKGEFHPADDPFIPPSMDPHPEHVILAPIPHVAPRKDKIESILDAQTILTKDRDIQHFLIHWEGHPDSECTWISKETLQ